MARRANRGTGRKRGPPKAKGRARKAKGRARRAPARRARHTVTPYLVIDGAAKAIEFYKAAFGAEEIDRTPMPDGTLLHATLRIGDSTIMLSDEFPGSDTKSPTRAGTTTMNLHIYSTDVDALWNRAMKAGARSKMPLENQFWGERYGKLQDPFGHIWSLSMIIKMSAQEKEAKRLEALAMFGAGAASEATPPTEIPSENPPDAEAPSPPPA